MNTKTRGECSEGIILAALLKKGLTVSIPFGNSQRYDFIIDENNVLLKAQCKTGRLVNGCVVFNTASCNGFTFSRTAYQGQVDLFLVYCPQTDSVYRVPIDKCGVNELRLRIDQPKGGATSRINWAKDFLL